MNWRDEYRGVFACVKSHALISSIKPAKVFQYYHVYWKDRNVMVHKNLNISNLKVLNELGFRIEKIPSVGHPKVSSICRISVSIDEGEREVRIWFSGKTYEDYVKKGKVLRAWLNARTYGIRLEDEPKLRTCGGL